MIFLLDANVLIALGWATHTHHHSASRWLSGRQFATCVQTQLAFLRLSTHPKLPYRATMLDARATLRSILAKPDHEFWAMDLPPLDHRPEAPTHEQLNDAYLVALAKERAARLATFDSGIPALAGADVAFVELLSDSTPPAQPAG
jgi:toxin-antitoxin system PIN domain toxin